MLAKEVLHNFRKELQNLRIGVILKYYQIGFTMSIFIKMKTWQLFYAITIIAI